MQRNAVIDIMKAIGILLVIVGHHSSGIVHQYLYSFHMPMFFIIAGYLWKERSIGQSLKHDSKRIMLPYLVYLLIVAGVDICCNGISIGRIEQNLLKISWGSVVNVNVYGHHVQGVGYLWFLPALFVCKNIFNALFVGFNNVWRRLSRGSMYVCMYVCMYEHWDLVSS